MNTPMEIQPRPKILAGISQSLEGKTPQEVLEYAFQQLFPQNDSGLQLRGRGCGIGGYDDAHRPQGGALLSRY